MTAAQWAEIVKAKGQQWADNWRNQNNIFVDGLPAPTYTGPLSTGGFAGELPPSNPSQTPVYAPQGTQKMDDEEVANVAAGEGDLGALSLLNMNPQDFLSQVAALNARASKVPTGMSAADYSEAEAKIKARRYGPSRSEQLFKLAAAIAKPTLSRGFGEIMGNIAPALADASKANREAEMARQDALDALKRQYLLEGRTGELANIAAQQKVLGTAAPLIAAGMKPAARRTGFNPITGKLQYMDTGEDVGNTGLKRLTPEEVAVLSRDPRNRGMKFLTTDGRPMEIK